MKLSHVLHGEGSSTPGAIVAYDLVLSTPTSNVRQVRETISRSRFVSWFGLTTGLVIGAGGGVILAYDSAGPGFRYGVGVPLVAVGAAATAFFAYMLALPSQESRTIPLGALPSP